MSVLEGPNNYPRHDCTLCTFDMDLLGVLSVIVLPHVVKSAVIVALAGANLNGFGSNEVLGCPNTARSKQVWHTTAAGRLVLAHHMIADEQLESQARATNPTQLLDEGGYKCFICTRTSVVM